MGRLSATSNPTGLKEIDRNRVAITVSETAGKREFSLDRIDVDGLGLNADLKVIAVARAGNTNIRYELGTVSNLIHDRKSLDALDRSQPLRFRILLHKDGDPRLQASVENLRPHDDSQSESLIPMEPADLGERLWNLAIEENGPVLQFNSSVFSNAAGTENYFPFVSFVLPEALRQVMLKIAEDPGLLDDANDPWSVWGKWLDTIGADRPPEDNTDESKDTWAKQVTGKFCEKFKFATRLKSELENGGARDN